MKRQAWRSVAPALVLIATLAAMIVRVPTSASSDEPAASTDDARVAAAREQAKLMHDIYSSALEVIHERYFRNDRSTVPARALEDVFRDLERQRNVQARWIGVNARTMSIPHEPKDEFEKKAAAALASGKSDFEAIEDGHLRRATPIPLHAGCLTCHGTFGVEVKTPRFAGLVLRLPLTPGPSPR
ncbi:MAG: DUF3365 domain-containing protein [Pirellulales bacterium]